MRYQVQYGGSGRGNRGYIVWDDETKEVVFQGDYKPACIARAQKLNGFTPTDGSEQTYNRQLRENSDKWGRDTRKTP